LTQSIIENLSRDQLTYCCILMYISRNMVENSSLHERNFAGSNDVTVGSAAVRTNDTSAMPLDSVSFLNKQTSAWWKRPLNGLKKPDLVDFDCSSKCLVHVTCCCCLSYSRTTCTSNSSKAPLALIK
jgi:hypothetical protein